MRLIDADKLSNKSCPMGKRKYCSNCGEKRTIKNQYTDQSISCDDIRFDFLQLIDREKTVKAIPIEWFKKEIDWHLETVTYGAEVYQWVLNRWYEDKENWEKENENR